MIEDEDEFLDKSIAKFELFDQDKTSVTIQVVFTDPTAISREILEPDTLVLSINNLKIFIDVETNQPLDAEKLEFKHQIG